VQFADVFPAHLDGSARARLFAPTSELPVPRYEPAAAWGLALLTPATNRTINSMFAEFEPPEAVIALHPEDAAHRGIDDGDHVRVYNELAAITLPCRLDASLRRGVAVIPKGLWRRHTAEMLTANALVPSVHNDLAHGACFNDARVEIETIGVRHG
jgi:anaerobic selenocysteine-containing dehydrogenase